MFLQQQEKLDASVNKSFPVSEIINNTQALERQRLNGHWDSSVELHAKKVSQTLNKELEKNKG